VLYLALSFYLLPALSAILKIRKRKLAQTGVDSASSGLLDSSNLTTDATRSFVSDFGGKYASLETDNNVSTMLSPRLNLLVLQAEVTRKFNFSIVSQAQLVAIFYV
jgi:hypothetical protein